VKNPYTKLGGYVIARHDPLCGWFVVQSSYAPNTLPPSLEYPWCVTSVDAGQTIYLRRKGKAVEIATRCADGCGLDKWRQEIESAWPDVVRPSHIEAA
jgi:hypothetical protein